MTDNNLLVRLEDLVNNPTARIPVCLCLDTSGSMEGKSIDELNEGVRLFYDTVREDEIALYSAEISIVTFGDEAKCISDFCRADEQSEVPALSAYGSTPMGEAVNMGLDLLEGRKQEYKSKGIDYYQPWLVLMTDGEPNGYASELTRAVNRTVEMVNNKKLTVFPIGIGAYADMNVLAQFSPKRMPLKLQGLKFREFFTWLSQSISVTSQSSLGDTVKLNTDGIKNWAEL